MGGWAREEIIELLVQGMQFHNVRKVFLSVKFKADLLHGSTLVLLQLKVVLLVQLELNFAWNGSDAIDEDAKKDDKMLDDNGTCPVGLALFLKHK